MKYWFLLTDSRALLTKDGAVLTDYRAPWPEELAHYSDSSYNRDSPAPALSRGIIVGVHPASRSLLCLLRDRAPQSLHVGVCVATPLPLPLPPMWACPAERLDSFAERLGFLVET